MKFFKKEDLITPQSEAPMGEVVVTVENRRGKRVLLTQVAAELDSLEIFGGGEWGVDAIAIASVSSYLKKQDILINSIIPKVRSSREQGITGFVVDTITQDGTSVGELTVQKSHEHKPQEVEITTAAPFSSKHIKLTQFIDTNICRLNIKDGLAVTYLTDVDIIIAKRALLARGMKIKGKYITRQFISNYSETRYSVYPREITFITE